MTKPTIIKIKNFGDLKRFVNNLTEKQLRQPVQVSETDRPTSVVNGIHLLECNYINPSGDGCEPVTFYKKGGDGYDRDFSIKEEKVVAKKGEIFLYADRKESTP